MPYADIRGVRLHMKIWGTGGLFFYCPERWEPDGRISLHNWKPSPGAVSGLLPLTHAAMVNPVRPRASLRPTFINKTRPIS